MDIERFDPVADIDKIQACYQLYTAGHPADDPGGPVMSPTAFRGRFSLGWTGAPREAWLVRAPGSGAAAAAYLLELPVTENQHLGTLSIWVDPGRRRAGLGTAMLRHAAARTRDHGRAVLSGESRQDAPGAAFAAAMGARASISDVRRVLDLADVPAGQLESLRRQADVAARGYSLLSWTGPCPDEYLDQLAAVSNALADAPRAPGIGPEYMDAERIRQEEHRAAARGLRTYTVAARPCETGDLAAISQLGVSPERPDWGFQELTAVTGPHRGHRLGLLVKLAMLDLLARDEPSVKHILTGNADTNRHMIAINIDLGFRVLSHWSTWHLDATQIPPPP